MVYLLVIFGVILLIPLIRWIMNEPQPQLQRAPTDDEPAKAEPEADPKSNPEVAPCPGIEVVRETVWNKDLGTRRAAIIFLTVAGLACALFVFRWGRAETQRATQEAADVYLQILAEGSAVMNELRAESKILPFVGEESSLRAQLENIILLIHKLEWHQSKLGKPLTPKSEKWGLRRNLTAPPTFEPVSPTDVLVSLDPHGVGPSSIEWCLRGAIASRSELEPYLATGTSTGNSFMIFLSMINQFCEHMGEPAIYDVSTSNRGYIAVQRGGPNVQELNEIAALALREGTDYGVLLARRGMSPPSVPVLVETAAVRFDTSTNPQILAIKRRSESSFAMAERMYVVAFWKACGESYYNKAAEIAAETERRTRPAF